MHSHVNCSQRVLHHISVTVWYCHVCNAWRLSSQWVRDEIGGDCSFVGEPLDVAFGPMDTHDDILRTALARLGRDMQRVEGRPRP